MEIYIEQTAHIDPILLCVTFLVFVLLNAVPGDPVALMMKEKVSADVVARVRAQMHLDDPWIIRYFRFCGIVTRRLGHVL